MAPDNPVRVVRLKLTPPEFEIVRIALRLLSTDACQDWLDHEREINPDGWSDAAADLYCAIWGKHDGAFSMEGVKATMNQEDEIWSRART